MNRKVPLILALLSIVVMQSATAEVRADEPISQRAVYSGTILSGETRTFQLSENLSRNSLVTLSVKTVTGGGKFTLVKGSSTVGEYSVSADGQTLLPVRLQFYPFVLPENGTGYVFNVTTDNEAGFGFSFFYDIAQAFGSQNNKSIPLEAGAVSYYADLDRGDRLSLKLTAPQNAEFDILAMPTSYAHVSSSFIPSMFNTFFTPAPKSLEFITDFNARYMVFVVATKGTGNFTLISSLTGNPVEGSLEFLRSRIDVLNNLVDNLILVCVVSCFLAGANLFMYLRLRKRIKQSGVVPTASEIKQSSQ